jgi:hypothetical protein
MATITRYRVTWDFPNGGPGVSTFYATGSTVAADLQTFFNAIKQRIPIGVTAKYDGVSELIEVETGTLQSASTSGTAWNVAGTGTGTWAAGVGASVKWITGAVVYGHRVTGRTFLAPLNSFSYDGFGTLDSSAMSEFATAAAALTASSTSEFSVYTRPKPAPGGIGPDRPGVVSAVVGSSVADKVATLRSRRT